MTRKNILIITISLCILSACTGGTQPQSASNAQLQSNTASVTDSGQILFESKCTGCHGADGTAGIGNAANLHISKLDSIAIIHTISDGKGAMPAFKNTFSEAEIQKLAGYARALRR